ncbi:hypothetical protein JCM15519_13050 [Fundidesulfovibrio butyratiphilus]
MPEPKPRRLRAPYTPPGTCARLYLRVAPKHLALLKFFLEGAGHLGLLTVVDRHAAVVRLAYSPDMAREAAEFLDQISQAVPHRVIYAAE